MNNAKASSKFFLDFRILSILLLLAVIPLLAGSWWLFRSYENAYLGLAGDNLSQAADSAFSAVNRYFQNQIIQIAGLTEVPTLGDAVKRGNLDLQKDLEAVRRAIPRMEAEWPGLKSGDAKLKAILDNPASTFLKHYTEVSPSYREIMVTDFLGRLVAASGKTTDYYQADEGWWKETYGDGMRGAVYIGDIVFDESTKTHAMEIAQPLVEPEIGVIGVVKVVLGAQVLHSIVGSFHAGPSGIAVLMQAKGEIISAAGYVLMDQSTYPATLEILNAREKGKRYFVSAGSPPAVFGLSQASFQELYPHLNWIMVTTGAVREVLGPLPQMRRYFIYMVAVVVLFSLFASVLISHVQSRPILEADAHLENL